MQPAGGAVGSDDCADYAIDCTVDSVDEQQEWIQEM